jgi:hypothetical protein
MTATINRFVDPIDSYKRDINVLQQGTEDYALYLHQMTKKPMEQCRTYVKAQLRPGGKFEFKDPEVTYLERGENGDREEKVSTLSKYLFEAMRDEDIIAPTLTTYLNPKVKKSLLVDYIDGNVKMRSVAKKEEAQAKVDGNTLVAIIKGIEQKNRKLSNNAISGAHVSESTILYNRTAHNTLTSTCRSTSGYGNANNEKILTGNRHYWSPEVTRNNIVSIIGHTDYDEMNAVMAKYQLKYPSAEETMECIMYSTSLYWNTRSQLERTFRLILTLTPEQRAAVVYTGDMYHLMKFNQEVVREFIGALSTRIGVVHPNPEPLVKGVSDDNYSLAVQLCPNEMKGKNAKKVFGTDAYGILASTIENIDNVLAKYSDLIHAFWVTVNVPASVAHFPTSIRRSALTSDTDSTIFTVQDWVIWYHGKLRFENGGNEIAATMIFLASQTITHVLARMSANLGIEQKRLKQIAMKNEFKFDVFTPTQVAKHYFALIGCREGNLYEEYEEEIKGVHLKASNASKEVMMKAQEMMTSIMNTVVAGDEIDLMAILKEIGDLERGVIASIKASSYEYFKRASIKPPETYTKGGEESPYQHYTIWEEIFSPKYGSTQPPTYTAVKVSVDLAKPGLIKPWLAKMKDRDMADRIATFMARTGKKGFTTMMLPEAVISGTGLPEEVMDAVNIRKIVFDTSKVFYIILETLGVYLLNKKMTRLVSDEY